MPEEVEKDDSAVVPVAKKPKRTPAGKGAAGHGTRGKGAGKDKGNGGAAAMDDID